MSSRGNINSRAKAAERFMADQLTEAGIPAIRVDRPNYSTKDTDVHVMGYPHLKIDTKSMQSSAHHSLFERDVVDRYCQAKGDIPIMPSKLKNSRGCLVTIQLSFFLELLKKWLGDRVPMSPLDEIAYYKGIQDDNKVAAKAAREAKRNEK